MTGPGESIGMRSRAQLRSDHHAIVVPHLFGVPSDFRPIRRAAAELGILVIEDCAHTVGGRIGKAVAGTLGDLAIFSFTYNKPISVAGGGVLLINNTRLEPLLQLPEPGISRWIVKETKSIRSSRTFASDGVR